MPGSITLSDGRIPNALVSVGSAGRPAAGEHGRIHPGSAPGEAPECRPPGGWCHRGLAGRLTELVIAPGSASLTLACSLVLDAQREGETTAWVMGREHTFFPPDLDAWGVDLDALAVVRVPTTAGSGKRPEASPVARAADRLARSGAFGLIVLDLGAEGHVPMPLLSRLLGLAIKHDIALLCLTESKDTLGSLVSLRAESIHRRVAEGRFTAGLRIIKDKRRAPGWTHLEECCGPPGLR